MQLVLRIECEAEDINRVKNVLDYTLNTPSEWVIYPPNGFPHEFSVVGTLDEVLSTKEI